MRHASVSFIGAALFMVACSSDTHSSGDDLADGVEAGDSLGADVEVIGVDGQGSDGAEVAEVADAGEVTDAAEVADGAEVTPGEFGAPCQGNVDCLDGFCVEGEEGFFCTRSCDLTCPDGFDCRSVQTGSSDPAFLCLPRLKKVCLPCKSDYQCTGGACLTIDGQGECGYACGEDADCPEGYACAADASAVHPGKFCQPKSGSCSCTKELEGAVRTCVHENALGACYGLETCDPATGWVGCDAKTASAEVCDGVDNNCNAIADEGVETNVPCQNTVEGVGTCTGTKVCIGLQGYICTAATPKAETCNFVDDNCDGQTDEGFRAPDGRYTLDQNCGTCGNDCTDRIPNGVGKCEAVGDTQPVCVVDRCDADYVAVGRFMCALPPDVSCQPCQKDDDCFGGSCVTLDNQKVCVSPCGAESDACQDGYACQDLGGGVKRCVPETHSCVCNATTDGQLRTCTTQNAYGTCFGQETCHAGSGWGACTAVQAAPEVCNGKDDDCNGVADDGVDNGAPCEKTIEGVGTCKGVQICVGQAGFVCTARDPLPETCNFADDDCDGQTDEDFRDVDGVFSNDANCGTCGNDCRTKIAHGVGRCDSANGASPICVVDQCDPDYVQLNGFQCSLPPDVSCQPCTGDDQCFGGSCVELDHQMVCVSACGANANACNDGYSCETIQGGKQRCMPDTGSCVCRALTNGQLRTCTLTTAYGTCFGQERCDGATGWSGCSAKAAAPEVCNGADDDCNGVADDGVDNGAACEKTVAGVGTCKGVQICLGQNGFACTAATPKVETCNFVDDDCDGQTDEDFKDHDGAFTLDSNCGTCGNDCRTKIAHGRGRCEVDEAASPICVVDSCDPDYYPVNRFQCSLPPDVSCQPCASDNDCFDGDCIPLDGQNVCVVPCGAAGSCQDGYTCTTVQGNPRCVPTTDSCICNERTDGQVRTCSKQNANGTCYGQETCDGEAGWIGCSAQTPAAETCNGIDDNCNSRVDDAVTPPSTPCQKTVQGVGTCSGVWSCTAAPGGGVQWVCSAATPAVEACDFADNDCDGQIDENFKNGSGLYVDQHNCGSCGVSCDGAIPNAASTTCNVIDGRARCEVQTCAAGYYKAGPLTCVAVSNDTCSPCASDANCPTPGDKCLTLDGGKFCGRDCSASNLHGTAEGVCPSGFTCQAFADSSKQCVPLSGSCACLSGDQGESRTCLKTNSSGTCYGQETCDASQGWVNCTARTPGVEVCNNIDDDCNGAVDDVAGRGRACAITNANGTCAGTYQCGVGLALQCVGKTPAAETCNYADDDCDGQTDEGFSGLFASCSAGKGACTRYGYTVCKANGSGTECNAVAGAPTTEKCDGIDNDCNDQTDEGAAFALKGTPCTVGTGYCQRTGVYVCSADGTGVTCSVTQGSPRVGGELCNGIDDDCDGATDEDFPTKGNVCSVGDGQCKAYGTLVCDGGMTGVTCTAVAGAPAASESCDLLDNDCNGQTDETFKTGSKYTAVNACGNCFTNCTAIFSGTAHGYGICNSTPDVPECKLSCCKSGDQVSPCNGAAVDYFDLDHVQANGCEFQLDTSAIYVSSADGDDTGNCGLGPRTTNGAVNYPCKTIARGLARAKTVNRTKVLVAGGAYNENVVLGNATGFGGQNLEGISLLGGYNPVTWTLDTAANLTAIFGVATSGHRKTVDIESVTTTATTFSGFAVYGQTATGVGENSYAIFVRNSNARLTLSNNVIWPGTGGPGQNGTRGSDGANGATGAAGTAAFQPPLGAFTLGPFACGGTCAAAYPNGNTGGVGGAAGACNAATAGGAGGNSTCPDFNETSDLCTKHATTGGNKLNMTFSQTNTNSGGGNPAPSGSLTDPGVGGCDSIISPIVPSGSSYQACNCSVPSAGGGCTLGLSANAGKNGTAGSPGAAGAAGAAGGTLSGADWVGNKGGDASGGSYGLGGGGGGGGGGVEIYADATNSCSFNGTQYTQFGGSGGGGGAGGCGGGGGTGGSAGGGAFGIFFVYTAAQAATPVLSGNQIHLGFGGQGGRGGDGGTAGIAGNGGLGGGGGDPSGVTWCAAPGAKGGEGGNGGPGGGGAGGNGGAAYGVFIGGTGAPVPPASWGPTTSGGQNTYYSDGQGGAGGAGGGVGAGGLAGSVGTAGTGAQRNW